MSIYLKHNCKHTLGHAHTLIHKHIECQVYQTLGNLILYGSRLKTYLCVHQPNAANRHDYHLVYMSFPLAFS